MRRTDATKLAAALLVCFCFGSIHAYGVLLAPIESWLGVSRAHASLGYSLAVLALTAGVYLNGRLDRGITAARRLVASGVTAAAGLSLAAFFPGGFTLLLGFGALYGLANGAAYGLSMNLAAQAMPGRAAMGMGLATAAYGLGAVLFAQLFAALLPAAPVGGLMLILALVLLLVCGLAALLAGEEAAASGNEAAAGNPIVGPSVLPLWTCYLLGAFSGLMVLAHAPGVARDLLGDDANAGLAAGAVSAGSVAGGYLGGLLAERFPARFSLALPLGVQTAVIAALPFLASAPSVAAALCIAGLCYGTLIAAVPAAVRAQWGSEGFGRAYGKVFSAWGIAGLLAPVMAGRVHDMTAHYTAALALAAVISFISLVLTLVRAGATAAHAASFEPGLQMVADNRGRGEAPRR